MGDVIHTLPALTDAQRAIPDLQVSWVVEENFAGNSALAQCSETSHSVAIRRWRKGMPSHDQKSMEKLPHFIATNRI